MKLIISTLVLFIIVFKCFPYEQVQVLKDSSQLSNTITAYADVSKFNSYSVQFNWSGAATATVTFHVSDDFNKGPTASVNWVSLDTLSMSSSATASYVKAFNDLPYKNMKISVATSATPTTLGIDMIGK